MCRWLAYSGDPVRLSSILLEPSHSLIDQSRNARLSRSTTNGDGFGIGWYGVGNTPGVFHSVEPAWSDHNLTELAGHLVSPLVFAHIRASTGTAVQKTNCHPFRHGSWLWMHNGRIRDFPRVRRDLAVAVDPSLFGRIEGSTDSELFFYLALTYGLERDPPEAVERAVGMIEKSCRARGIGDALQMTVATTDGRTVWVFRYASDGGSPSLFYSTSVATLRLQHPDVEVLHDLSDETRLVVSEPLGSLAGVWNEVPESTCAIIQPGDDELRPFGPRPA
jgi:predicted glutamine amidotransferase